MKKTKIIIPALSILCLSAAASVSGTLAWFSASRTGSISMSNLAIVNPVGALTVSATAGANTSVTGTTVSMMSDYQLRDASVSVKAGTKYNDADVFGATTVDESGAASAFKKISYGTNAPNYVHSGTIVYAASWTLSLSYNGTPEEGKKNQFYFNASSSSLTKDETKGGTDAIWNAYRFAFITKDAVTIWAPKRADDASLTYISKEDGTTGTYTNEKKDGAVLGDGSSLDVVVYMWLEGEDESCISGNLTAAASALATATIELGCKDVAAA